MVNSPLIRDPGYFLGGVGTLRFPWTLSIPNWESWGGDPWARDFSSTCGSYVSVVPGLVLTEAVDFFAPYPLLLKPCVFRAFSNGWTMEWWTRKGVIVFFGISVEFLIFGNQDINRFLSCYMSNKNPMTPSKSKGKPPFFLVFCT